MMTAQPSAATPAALPEAVNVSAADWTESDREQHWLWFVLHGETVDA